MHYSTILYYSLSYYYYCIKLRLIGRIITMLMCNRHNNIVLLLKNIIEFIIIIFGVFESVDKCVLLTDCRASGTDKD